MRTVLFALLLAASCIEAWAVEPEKAPILADLMKQPANRAAWYGMFASDAPPQWVDDYAKSLDGPPTPSIPVEANGQVYMLSFTCKPNDCSDNQLFVLFSPGGAKAWGLLMTGNEKKWFGSPDQAIQDAILSSLQ